MNSKKMISEGLQRYLNAVNRYAFKGRKNLVKQLIIIGILIVISSVLFTYSYLSKEDTPLGSLQSNQASAKFDHYFWLNEAKSKSNLWNSAVSYCSQPTNIHKINCIPLIRLNLSLTDYSTFPKYGSNNEGFGKIPNFTN